MTVDEAAEHFGVNRKTILAICADSDTGRAWGCRMVFGRWAIESPPLSRKWYTPARVAIMMNKSRVQVWRWCTNGTVLAVKVGKKYRIPQSELIKLIQKRD